MGLFRKKGSNNPEPSGVSEAGAKNSNRGSDPPPPPPVGDVLVAPNTVMCTINERWQWLLEAAFKERNNLSIVSNSSELPTASMPPPDSEKEASPPATPSARRRFKKPATACPLRVEVKDVNGRVIRAAHADSEGFDGLEDKDELFRTLQRCRCEHLDLSPPSRLVNWDVTSEECKNVVGQEMPSLLKTKDSHGGTFAVLKEPMGSSGTGIFFVQNAEEIHAIINEHKKEAMAKPNFLDDLIASKGRIPSWVLQAEVLPCLTINQKKFHIRTYVVGVERWDMDEMIDTFVYKRHEVRTASEPMPADRNDTSRPRPVHVTNGAEGTSFLDEVEELKGLQDELEMFVAQFFAKHVIRDLSRRVAMSAQDASTSQATKFVIAGLDVMVTEDKRLYMLEANVPPIMPPPDVVKEDFKLHMIELMSNVVDLVVGKQPPNFVSCKKIISKLES